MAASKPASASSNGEPTSAPVAASNPSSPSGTSRVPLTTYAGAVSLAIMERFGTSDADSSASHSSSLSWWSCQSAVMLSNIRSILAENGGASQHLIRDCGRRLARAGCAGHGAGCDNPAAVPRATGTGEPASTVADEML